MPEFGVEEQRGDARVIEDVDQFGSGQAGVERDEHTAGQRDRVVRDEHLRDVGCEIGDPLTARDPALENPGEALHLVGELRVTRATIPVDDRCAVAEHRCAAFKESQRTQFGPVGAATIDPAEVASSARASARVVSVSETDIVSSRSSCRGRCEHG